MKIRDALEVACTNARSVKEAHVRRVKGKPDHTDIMTVVACYRGDEQVAAVFSPPDRDRMIDIAWVAATGFSPDVLAVTMETFQAHALQNPVTGEDWGAGEMTDVALNHDGLAKGWVFEALMTHVLNRAGDSEGRSQPYALHGREVEWLETSPEDATLAGYVVDRLVEAMNRPTVTQMYGRDPLAVRLASELGHERAQAHADVAVVRVIEERLGGDVMVMLAAKPGSVREQVIRKRFPRSKVIRPDAEGS